MNLAIVRSIVFVSVIGLMVLTLPIGLAQDKPKSDDTKSKAEPEIDFDVARQLLRKRNAGERLTDDEDAYLKRAIEARQKGNRNGPVIKPRESIGVKPLSEMTFEDRYKGQDGGLYGKGQNVPPDAHQHAARHQLDEIEPLDANGKPSEDGRIVFVSISMSNATQEFSKFKQLADADQDKSPKLTIVDCAQGGQAMAEWVPRNAQPWTVAEQRLAAARVSPQQVQVAWIKLANKGPRGDLEEHGKILQKDTQAVIQNAKARFPNLRIAYLSSRIYGGYAEGALNPEPYAYESAFPVRWLIQAQIKGEPALNFDDSKGDVKAPLLLWGPYLWADGTKPRAADKLVYKRDDLARDGTHPSEAGREKVAKLMLEFFKTNELSKSWFAWE